MDAPSEAVVECTIRHRAVALKVVLPANGRLERVHLRHVEELNIVHVELAIAHLHLESDWINIQHEANCDLATPGLNILADDLDIARQKHNLASHVEAGVEIAGRSLTPKVVVIESAVSHNLTSLTVVALDKDLIKGVPLIARRQQAKPVTRHPVQARLDEEASVAFVGDLGEAGHDAVVALLAVCLHATDDSDELVASLNRIVVHHRLGIPLSDKLDDDIILERVRLVTKHEVAGADENVLCAEV